MNVTVLSEDIGCAEGPIQLPDGDFVVVSIDRGILYRITSAGERTNLAMTGGGPNGLTVGPDGTIYVAQSGGRSGLGPPFRRAVPGGVQAIRADGGQEWITLDPISPNDLCFGPDGDLYVTDPTDELRDGRIWRVDVERRRAELLLSTEWYTNGIGFGPEDQMWVTSTWDGKVYRFPFDGGKLGKPEAVFEVPNGHPDGFAFDVEGNLVLGVLRRPGPAEIQTWSPSGELIDVFAPGDVASFTNLMITPDARLVVTLCRGAPHGVLMIDPWPCAGLPLHPFRQA